MTCYIYCEGRMDRPFYFEFDRYNSQGRNLIDFCDWCCELQEDGHVINLLLCRNKGKNLWQIPNPDLDEFREDIHGHFGWEI